LPSSVPIKLSEEYFKQSFSIIILSSTLFTSESSSRGTGYISFTIGAYFSVTVGFSFSFIIISDKRFACLLSLAVTRVLLCVSLVSALCEMIGKCSSRCNSLSVAKTISLEENLFSFMAISSSTLYRTEFLERLSIGTRFALFL